MFILSISSISAIVVISIRTMVCIICFDVFALIEFLKHDRYSSEVTKPINNPDVTYTTFHWLKLVRPCVAQKCLDSNPASLRKGLSIALE